MNAMLTHVRMEITLFFREIIAIFFTFLLPGVSFAVLGQMFKDVDYSKGSYFDLYIPGMIAIIVFTTGFFTIGVQLVTDREKGVYRRLQGTPLNPLNIFTGIFIKGFIAVFAGAVEIILIAKLYFKADITPDYIKFFLAGAFVSITFFALGFLIASLAKKMQTALAISFVSMYPMLFLSGATLPIESLPDVLQKLSKYIPLTAVINVLQSGWNGTLFHKDLVFDYIYLLVLLVCSLFISIKYFKWQS
ncbi:ABC transporter permease [Bacillus sp. T33-2]|uniref:ABC transporter permease n=1 Tax=Bacillus sp. T33-2 TaxID=2054168 RepID=UPI000C7575C1|nr:ABC transporter permease [Bacillus sp. T33-2]PLR91094.1 ABC transporter permease [Bacillus sp. T33-2]